MRNFDIVEIILRINDKKRQEGASGWTVKEGKDQMQVCH